MKTTYTLLLMLLICSGQVRSQTTGWNFSTGAQGWTLTHSLAGTVSGDVYHLAVTGPDPYMISPSGLNIDATQWGQLHVRFQNGTPATRFQVFWITTADAVWNQAKSIFYTVSAYDTTFEDYTINFFGNNQWSGTINQIRLDVGDNDNVGDSVLLNQVNFNAYEMGLNDGIVHVRLDMSCGGAIAYISNSDTTLSIVNIGDLGRYIQQSYYSGVSVNRQSQGQNSGWSPWPWNPIQVGDSYNHHGTMLNYTKGDTLYTKSTPMQWDMDSMPAQATMEQWTSLSGNIITVRNQLTCFRTDTIYGANPRDQELPATYIISALNNLYSYFGSQPFTSAPVQQVPVVNLSSGFWGVYDTTSEHWMAFVNDTLWGIGVYNPNTSQFLAGLSGVAGQQAANGSTDYIAPIRFDTLLENCVYDYTYYLIIGTLDEIRSAVYQLNSNPPTAVTKLQQEEISIYPNPARTKVTIKLNQEPTEKITLELFNAQSKLLYINLLNSANYEMNIANLSKGIYFIRLSGDKYVLNKKLVIE